MSLAKIKAKHGEVTQGAVVLAMLDDIEDFYGVEATSKAQKQMLIPAVFKSYYYLKISDLKLFAERFKAGMYGKIYNRIDGGTIMDGLKKYDTERAEEAAVFSQIKHGEIKHEESKYIDPKVAQKVVDVFSRAKITEREVKPAFMSLESYCRYTGLLLEDVKTEIEGRARRMHQEAGIDIEFEDYHTYMINLFLDSESRNK